MGLINPVGRCLWTNFCKYTSLRKLAKRADSKSVVCEFDSHEKYHFIWASMHSWRLHLTVNQAHKKHRRFDSYLSHHGDAIRRNGLGHFPLTNFRFKIALLEVANRTYFLYVEVLEWHREQS